ncbi:MAG TPA: maleylpyruvate isomerase N-terminal domain-containing protein [Actinomycetota bacterium]
MATAAQSNDKAFLLAREREAWASWWLHVADVDPAATRHDGWSLKDVISHIAAWQRYSSGRLAAIGRGRPDPGPPVTDAFNEQAREEGRLRSWKDVRADAERVHEAFLATIEAVPQEALTREEGLGAFVITVNGVEHYEEHVPDEFGTR